MAYLQSKTDKIQSKASRKKLALRIDMTAMVDLAFLLLVFYMLLSFMNKPKAMDYWTSGDCCDVACSLRSSLTITACLSKAGKIEMYTGFVDDMQSSGIVKFKYGSFRKRLVEFKNEVIKQTGKQPLVLIKPSAHCTYGDLVSALDEIKVTNILSYSVADVSPAEVNELKAHGAY